MQVCTPIGRARSNPIKSNHWNITPAPAAEPAAISRNKRISAKPECVGVGVEMLFVHKGHQLGDDMAIV
jgi:hypothetical protein